MPEVEALTGPDRPAVTTIEVDRRARTGAWPVVRGVCRRAFDRRYSGLWVLVALIAIFSALKPQYFPTRVTVMTILSNQAVIGILAIAAMIPLLTGLVDLSIAGVAGFAVVFAAWLSTRVSVNPIVLCLVVLVVTSGFGLLSGGLVTRLGINSIVTTLGVSTVALGLAESFAGGNTITPRFSPRLFKFGQSHLSVIPLSFIYFAVLA
ncbi:MAG TPA: hypothetical protein VMU14_00650, partial [Acidimicrobiales bacterium]|nr:hypothetical protein [Acidimicrobiales bacterium]